MRLLAEVEKCKDDGHFWWMCKSGFVRINSALPPRLGVPGPGPEQPDPVHGEPAGAARWLVCAPLRRAQPLRLGPDQTHVRVSVLLSLASKTIFTSSYGCKCLEFWHGQRQSSLHRGHPPLLCVCAKSPLSCLTLCNPTDCSPPGSSVHGASPGKKTGLDCQVPLQDIFPTQGLNLHLLWLLHCRRILYFWATGDTPALFLVFIPSHWGVCVHMCMHAHISLSIFGLILVWNIGSNLNRLASAVASYFSWHHLLNTLSLPIYVMLSLANIWITSCTSICQ